MEIPLVQYMVDFALPATMTDEFVNRIPQHRAVVNRLLGEGKILNYALSLENARLWVVFSVASEDELHETIERLPLAPYLKARVSQLTFFNAAHPFMPAFSVN